MGVYERLQNKKRTNMIGIYLLSVVIMLLMLWNDQETIIESGKNIGNPFALQLFIVLAIIPIFNTAFVTWNLIYSFKKFF